MQKTQTINGKVMCNKYYSFKSNVDCLPIGHTALLILSKWL